MLGHLPTFNFSFGTIRKLMVLCFPILKHNIHTTYLEFGVQPIVILSNVMVFETKIRQIVIMSHIHCF